MKRRSFLQAGFLGVAGLILFGIPEHKDPRGSQAAAPDGMSPIGLPSHLSAPSATHSALPIALAARVSSVPLVSSLPLLSSPTRGSSV